MGDKKSGKSGGKKGQTLTGKAKAPVRARAKRPRSELTDLEERFCVKYAAQGFSNAAGALEAAGSRANYKSRCSSASRMLRKDKVQARLKQLSSAADKRARKLSEKGVVSLAERKARLSEIVRATAGDLKGIAMDGNRLVFDDESIRSAVQAKAQIISVPDPAWDPNDADSPVKCPKVPAVLVDLALHDPLKAIQELNKMDGVYKEGSLLPAEIHIHTGGDEVLKHDEQTEGQLADPSLRVAIPGSPADKARFRKKPLPPPAGGDIFEKLIR